MRPQSTRPVYQPTTEPTWRGKPPVEVMCLTCGQHFLKHACALKINPRSYCSRQCSGAARRGIPHTEESRRNLSERFSGERGPNWKGGNSRQFKRGYKSEQYKRWRTSVFQRDAYTCQNCGQVGGYLTAHHVKPFAEYPDFRYDTDNGVTLCESCHSESDNYYARLHPSMKKGG